MIVVDSSVLIGFFRGQRGPAVERFRRLELDDVPYQIPALCCQEVLQGAKDEREWRLLRDALATQRILSAGDPLALHVEAARIYFDCRRKGVTVSGTVDCYIAAQVLAVNGTLLHDDDDYERIRKLRPLETLRS